MFWCFKSPAAALLVSSTQQIHIKSYCSRDARRQLAEEERVSCVDVRSFAILRAQQAALLLRLSGIVGRQQRREVAVPLIHKIQSALLYPSVEIMLANLIGIMEDAIARSQNRDRSLFNRNPHPAKPGGIRGKFTFVEIRRCQIYRFRIARPASRRYKRNPVTFYCWPRDPFAYRKREFKNDCLIPASGLRSPVCPRGIKVVPSFRFA